MKLLCILVSIFIASEAVLHRKAVDVKQPLTQAQVLCMDLNLSISKMFIRAYTSQNGGMVDHNVCNTYQLTKNSNIEAAIYMEPSPRGTKTGAAQFKEMNKVLKGFSCMYDAPIINSYLWVSSPNNWNEDTSKNNQLIKDILAAAAGNSKFTRMGIYTNADDWAKITGNVNNTLLSGDNEPLSLWWNNGASGNSTMTLDGFKPFGGWTSYYANIVQYSQEELVCTAICNRNFYSV